MTELSLTLFFRKREDKRANTGKFKLGREDSE
jgi:hypothetical protein